MAKTTIKAAAQWHGEGFAMEDTPHWLVQAIGGGKLAFDPPNLGVTTSGGPVSAAEGDWLMLLEDDTLASATDDDFHTNYEIAE